MKNHRRNMTRLFRREGFAYIPVQFELSPIMVDKFEAKFGHRDYADEFDFPVRYVHASFQKQTFTGWRERYFPGIDFLDSVSFDSYGVAHESTPESMHMSRMYHPMEHFTSLEEFRSYPYPQFDPSQTEDCRREAEQLHQEGYFVGVNMQCTIWEKAWYMRSMEEMMIGMMSGDEETLYHLDRLTELACRRAEAFARAGVDLIFLGDDVGMQSTIMMSLELYREFLKPRLRKVIEAARQVNPGVLIAYHSCGYVAPLIGDLVEAGIDILNPVQPECMDFAEIHEQYGDRLSFWGTLGTQTLFPFGTPEEVACETLKNLQIAGQRGGLLPAPTHLVEPEVPLENILAYVEACRGVKA